MRWLLVSLFALVAIAMPRVASAHQVGLSRGEYTAEGNVLHVELTFARGDAELLPPSADLVTVAGCTSTFDGFEPTSAQGGLLAPLDGTPSADGMRMRAHYTCPEDAKVFSIDASFIDELAQGHRHMAHAGNANLVLQSKQAHIDLPTTGIVHEGPSLAKLVVMGLEHILTGWDHLAFLFGLLLLGGRLRALALTISAFTIAHSITLGLAAFGVWTPPSSIIEPAIALSIAWVGVENVRALFMKRAQAVSESRWRITLPFGLVHGFGFAGALGELGMSRADIPRALFGFNVGVELGQLAVVVPLALGLAWIGKRGLLSERAVRFASAGIVALGLVWFALRIA